MHGRSDGKGVEELSEGESKSLRQKIPVEQAFDYYQVSKREELQLWMQPERKHLGKTEPSFSEEIDIGSQKMTG